MHPSIIRLTKSFLLCSFFSWAVGCSQQPVIIQQMPEPSDISPKAEFEECLSSLAEPLANANNPASYHSSAKYALACLEEVPAITNGSVQVSVMQLHALVISHLLKAGDMQAAAQQLSTFKSRFPRQDLLLEEGASFIHTVELMLGQVPIEQSANSSLLNASRALKSELRRQQYWQIN